METPPKAVRYAALGDSFTSGPNLDRVREEAPGCGRSLKNYPAIVGGWLDAEVTDVSCAGAISANVTQPQTTLVGSVMPPQIEAVSADMTLVTMGFGANDLLVYAGVVGCRTAGAPCFVDETTADAAQVRPGVAEAVTQVREAAPAAEVYVIGYPQILPADAGCLDVTAPPEVLARLDEAMVALNTAVREGAEESGATYVDLWTPSQGHHVCAGDQAWIAGDAIVGGEGAPYHWNTAGMQAAARLIHEAITGEEPPR